jgi:hypothetical protein
MPSVLANTSMAVDRFHAVTVLNRWRQNGRWMLHVRLADGQERLVDSARVEVDDLTEYVPILVSAKVKLFQHGRFAVGRFVTYQGFPPEFEDEANWPASRIVQVNDSC